MRAQSIPAGRDASRPGDDPLTAAERPSSPGARAALSDRALAAPPTRPAAAPDRRSRAADGPDPSPGRSAARAPERAAPVAAAAQHDEPPLIHLLGVPLHDITSAQTLEFIGRSLGRGRGGWVLTPNLDILRRLVRQPDYAAVCSAATLRVADGMPLVWASRLRQTPLRERVAGSDLIWRLSERAAREGWSVYFLGGNPGAAECAASRLADLNPGLHIVGIECPPLGFDRDPIYMAGLKQRLAALPGGPADSPANGRAGGGPDICFVALGGEKQDRVIRELMQVLPHTWLLGIGISFSFVSGEIRRAPVWMRRAGLEWLHRLAQEPRRLARRYLRDGLPFAAHLLAASAWEGFHRRRRSRRARTPEARPAAPAGWAREVAGRGA